MCARRFASTSNAASLRTAVPAFFGHGLIERVDAKEMQAYQNSGFSVDAGACIEAHVQHLPWTGYAKRALPWCTAAPSSTANLAVAMALAAPAQAATAHYLWADYGDAQMVDGAQIEPDWDLAAQPASDYEIDQRVNWLNFLSVSAVFVMPCLAPIPRRPPGTRVC